MTRIANDTEFNGNKVLNGNVSGKEIKIKESSIQKGEKPPNATTNVENNNLADALKNGAGNKEALSQLGEGKFRLEFTKVDGTNVNINLIDTSDFNGGKEYVIESTTVTHSDENVKFSIGGIELNVAMASIKQNGTGGSVTFTNEVTKKGEGVNLQVGANKDQMIGFSIENMRSRELGLGGMDLLTAGNSQEAIERLDVAVKSISAQMADLGAAQNRLEHTIASTDNTAENLQAAESRIRDVDMAKEMMNLTKLNVLQQALQAMLSQANQAPQQVLQILR